MSHVAYVYRRCPRPPGGLAVRRLLLAMWLVAAGVSGGETLTEYTLREQLNRLWTMEFVSFPVALPEGRVTPEQVGLVGPDGRVPGQLFDITLWPDNRTVRTARMGFVVERLEPLSVQQYRVVHATADAAPPVGHALQYHEEGDLLEAASASFAVRFRLGDQKFEPPRAPAEIPGPIAAMRNAAGDWFGGSRLYGDMAVRSFRTTVVERGAVLVRLHTTCLLADDTRIDIHVRFDASGGLIEVETQVDHGSHPASGWEILLSPGLPPLALQYWRVEPPNQRLGGRDVNGWLEKTIGEFAPGPVMWLEPFGEPWSEVRQPAFYLVYLNTPAALARQPGAALEKSMDDLAAPTDDVIEGMLTEFEADVAPEVYELMVRRRRPEIWAEPAPIGTMAGWGRWEPRLIPLIKDDDNQVRLRINHVEGRRAWVFGEQPAARRPSVAAGPRTMPADEVWPLDDVNQLVLDWPASEEPHPRLFMDRDAFLEAAERLPAAAAPLLDIDALRQGLGSLGYFDTMRMTASIVGRYDALIDSDRVTADERALFRAQMAYLAYRIASPGNWSAERGYRSYNPNMTVAHTINLGLVACTLRDHPMAQEWIADCRTWFESWLERLDPSGYWNESSHYGRYAVSNFIPFAIALQRAGAHNYLADPRFQRMGEWYEKTLTPPDRLVAPKRLSPPLGRGSHSCNWGLGGLLAAAAHEVAPDFSRRMQWSARATDFGTVLGSGMAGYGPLYMRHDLPAEKPDWRSEWLPSIGPLLRSHLGEEHENYLLMAARTATNPDGEIWPSEVGGIMIWFARGIPISRRFSSVPNLRGDHGLTVNRVMLASHWQHGERTPGGYATVAKHQGSAFLPILDATHMAYHWREPWNFIDQPPAGTLSFPETPRKGSPPADWDRQLLWVKPQPGIDVQYLLLRDSVRGGQPSQWQFWTLSRHLEERDPIPEPTPLSDEERLEQEIERLFDDAMEAQPATNTNGLMQDRLQPQMPPGVRSLHGDRFTAVGRWGVDVDYFVASPDDTPRQTMRLSQAGHGYGVPAYTIAQDLLHLQLAADGDYFVALHPRAADAPAPRFTTSPDKTIMRAEGDWGVDYAFLVKQHQEAALDDASFAGTVGFVRAGGATLHLATGAPGLVRYRQHALRSTVPAAVSIGPDRTLLSFSHDRSDHAEVTLYLPDTARWQLQAPVEELTLNRHGERLELHIPSGLAQVVLIAGKPDQTRPQQRAPKP